MLFKSVVQFCDRSIGYIGRVVSIHVFAFSGNMIDGSKADLNHIKDLLDARLYAKNNLLSHPNNNLCCPDFCSGEQIRRALA